MLFSCFSVSFVDTWSFRSTFVPNSDTPGSHIRAQLNNRFIFGMLFSRFSASSVDSWSISEFMVPELGFVPVFTRLEASRLLLHRFRFVFGVCIWIFRPKERDHMQENERGSAQAVRKGRILGSQ